MVNYQSGPVLIDLQYEFIQNLELLYSFSFTATYYTITHNYILNYSLNWY